MQKNVFSVHVLQFAYYENEDYNCKPILEDVVNIPVDKVPDYLYAKYIHVSFNVPVYLTHQFQSLLYYRKMFYGLM